MADDNTDLPAVPPITEWDLDLKVSIRVYLLPRGSRQLLKVGFYHVTERYACSREF